MQIKFIPQMLSLGFLLNFMVAPLAAQELPRIDEAWFVAFDASLLETNNIVASSDPLIGEPLLAVYISPRLPDISDRTEADPFTQQESYVGSSLYCRAQVVVFSLVANRRVLLGTGDEYTPRTIAITLTDKKGNQRHMNAWLGGFATPNMILSDDQEPIDYAVTEAMDQSGRDFASREEAEAAAVSYCDLSRTTDIALFEIAGFYDGIRVEGESREFLMSDISSLTVLERPLE